MTAHVLVDTSVLTRLDNPVVRSAIDRWGPGVARSSLTGLELGHSARTTDEWDQLHRALEAFNAIEIEGHHFRRAAQVQRLLAGHGLRGRKVPDLLIAACAEDRGLTVVHYDRDFELIASVTGQQADWLVPPGSVD